MCPLRLSRETENPQGVLRNRGAMNRSLTRRQLQIIEMLSNGASDHDICRALGIAERTVRWHLAHIHERLDTRTRPQAVAVALRWRLLPCPCPPADECPLCPNRER